MNSAKDRTPVPAPIAEQDAAHPEGKTTITKPTRSDGKNGQRPTGADVGDALRAVYREAVAEAVPDEMLDLLNKLG